MTSRSRRSRVGLGWRTRSVGRSSRVFSLIRGVFIVVEVHMKSGIGVVMILGGGGGSVGSCGGGG
jgi:hypothetical protein